MSDDVPQGPSELQLQQAMRLGIAATERGDYPQAIKVFKVLYEDPRIKVPVEGLSFYGLCVAIEDKQTKKGIDLCKAAIAAQFYDSRHYVNLIRLHLKKGNKPSAVEVLNDALSRMPKDSSILKLQAELGMGARPPIGFLHRDNPLNRWLQSRRKKPRSSKFHLENVHPAVTGLVVLIIFAAIFGTVYYYLYEQAYGEPPAMPWSSPAATPRSR